MAKGGNQKNVRSTAADQTNPEAEERKRLKKHAISKNLLSETPAKASSLALNPSKTVIKHHGIDILRKSNQKNRFLFSFPGLFAPVTGGKVGELKNLGSKNPILYLDFLQVIRTLVSKGAGSDSYAGPSKLFQLVKAPSSFSMPLHFLPKREFRTIASKNKEEEKLRKSGKEETMNLTEEKPGSASKQTPGYV